MPIYEYECQLCGKHVEYIQKVDEPALVDCPECGKPGLHRLLSAPSFQLKGQGWYVTDFRGDKKANETKKSEPNISRSGGTGSDKKGSEKSDSPKIDSTQTESNKQEKPASKKED